MYVRVDQEHIVADLNWIEGKLAGLQEAKCNMDDEINRLLERASKKKALLEQLQQPIQTRKEV